MVSYSFCNVHRRRVHPALVSVAIRRTHCADDVDVVHITFKNHNVHNVDTLRKR